MTNKKPAPSTPIPARRRESADRGQRRDAVAPAPREIGGPRGKEPTRYGDWEKNGRCIDF